MNASPLPAQESPEMAAFRQQIESQLSAMKTGYADRIRELESRIHVLETDNARLKKSGTTGTTAQVKKDGDQPADIEKRVASLE
ncbi:MAG: hypothetical protein EOP14_05255, partial [Pseudomonas sp.]